MQLVLTFETTGEPEGDPWDHGVLAAQAPAMARLLLKLDCVVCFDPRKNGHKPECELGRVLRAAGVLEAPSPFRERMD